MAAGAYSSRVLIGNWSEDIELEQTKLREYLDRKERHELALGRRDIAGREVALSVADDGCVHIGDYCMLLNENTSGFLGVDLADVLNNTGQGARGFAVATSLADAPLARNTFAVVRAEQCRDDDGRLRYGDKIRFATHETLSGKPLYLHSQPVSMAAFAKKSRHAECCVVPKANWNTVWEVLHFDPLLRFEAEGRLVPANGRVVIRHCATHAALASPLLRVTSSHGDEFEVCAHTYLNSHKAETAENHWLVVLAAPAADQPEPTTAAGAGAGAAAWL